MDQRTLDFLQLVANAISLAEKGYLTQAQALMPQIKDWIKTNAPSVTF